jgi:hypothetical protein
MVDFANFDISPAMTNFKQKLKFSKTALIARVQAATRSVMLIFRRSSYVAMTSRRSVAVKDISSPEEYLVAVE